MSESTFKIKPFSRLPPDSVDTCASAGGEREARDESGNERRKESREEKEGEEAMREQVRKKKRLNCLSVVELAA